MIDDKDKPMRGDDLDAWGAQEPPSGFAERVIAQAMREASSKRAPAAVVRPGRARRIGIGAVAVFAAAIAAAFAMRAGKLEPSTGDLVAEGRIQVPIGARASAVLEPGAHVTWRGDVVSQDKGDVFYRVEPGAPFRVHTPAGDAEVHGTCFRVKVRTPIEESDMQKRDVKSGAIGAALSALAFVAVYEGKVAVSHAQESVMLTPGETAEASQGGVHRTGDLGAGEKSFDAKSAALAGDLPFAEANKNLTESVREYKTRLGAIEEQKLLLEKQLKASEEKLAIAQNDGTAPKRKNEFELSPDDWKELAKDGTMKFQVPCSKPPNWTASGDQLNKLGLALQDGATLQNAYAQSKQRLWGVVKPICAQTIGNAEVAEKLGMNTCMHLILDSAREKDKEGASESMRRVAEVRAGMRPMPGPNDPVSPVERVFLTMTGEMKLFEADLAQSLGPEEAHRVAYSDEICVGKNTWGGPGPRKP